MKKGIDISDTMIIIGVSASIYGIIDINLTVGIIFAGMWITLLGLYIGNSGRS